MRETYDLNFLKEQAFFKKEQALKDKLPSGEQITCVFDPDNRMAYFEDIKGKKIGEAVKHLKERFNFDYYWFWEKGRLVVFRTFGENKRFIFNIGRAKERRKTEFLKSKIKKVSEFSVDNPNILFDVKDMINHFYKRLWKIRIDLALSIQEDLSSKEKILAAQRLIDRLIFVYFLGEKEIIKGKDKRGVITPIDIKELFKYLLKESKDFHKFLNRMFFEFLNSTVKNEMRIPGKEEFSLIIPYLNGGLFREKTLKTKLGTTIGESHLSFEGFNLNELIEELNKYNWIIEDYILKEDEEAIGNLSPEILGHIYEKFVIAISELGEINIEELSMTSKGELREERKKIGGYYTPEDVTKYISENTLFPYVQEKMGLNNKFVSFEEFYNEFRVKTKKLEELDKHLSEITILDPAVGSGHFLMTAADLLYDWRKKCGTKLDNYSLRKDIIKNNLYGVDIMEGAVEICKLRLWLWLIASLNPDSKPEPLPNIDFNIMEGNSLIGFIKERKIGQEQIESHFVKDYLKEYMEKIEKYKDEHKEAEKLKKDLDHLHKEIKKGFDKLHEILLNIETKEDLESIDNALSILKECKTSELELNLIFKKEMNDEIKRKLDTIRFRTWKKKAILKIDPRIDQWKVDRVFNNIPKEDLSRAFIKRKLLPRDLKTLKVFHWIMEFPYIFTSEGREKGFDIVVGNPPYIEDRNYNKVELDIIKLPKVIKTRKGQKIVNPPLYQSKDCGNTYAYFIERSIKLLKQNGKFGFIVPISLVSTDRMAPIRDFIHNNSSKVKYYNFDDRPGKIFNGLEHCRSTIIITEKGTGVNKVTTSKYHRWYSKDRSNLFRELKISNWPLVNSGDLIPKIGSEKEKDILYKLRKKSNGNLGDFIAEKGVKIYYYNAVGYWIHTHDEESVPYAEYYDSLIEKDGLRIPNNLKERKLSSHYKILRFNLEDSHIVSGLLNSSLFYWWFVIWSDGRDLLASQINNFPISLKDIPIDLKDKIKPLVDELMKSYDENSNIKIDQRSGGNVIKIKEIIPLKSKYIIDAIDDIFLDYFGFIDEERKFIKNFDIKIRIG